MKRDGNKLEAFIIFSWIINFLSFHSYIEKLLNYFKLRGEMCSCKIRSNKANVLFEGMGKLFKEGRREYQGNYTPWEE